MTAMMHTGFWESSPVSNLSDLDVAWSPNSSGSDQENQFNYFSPSQQLLSPASSTSTNTSSPAKRYADLMVFFEKATNTFGQFYVTLYEVLSMKTHLI